MANYDHSCYYFIISYFLLLLAVMSSLLITPTRSYDDKNLVVTCTSSDNDIKNATLYIQNRGNLLDILANMAPESDPHDSYALVRADDDDGWIYGLALCRGDISADDCGTCLANATAEILQKNCTKQMSIIFRNHCLMKYSNVDFFVQLDTTGNAYSSCYGNGNDRSYPPVTKDFADEIIRDAITTDKMFASNTTGAYNVLVQCVRWIPKDDCTNCLRGIVSELVRGCVNKSGGEYYTGSCIVVYSWYKIE